MHARSRAWTPAVCPTPHTFGSWWSSATWQPMQGPVHSPPLPALPLMRGSTTARMAMAMAMAMGHITSVARPRAPSLVVLPARLVRWGAGPGCADVAGAAHTTCHAALPAPRPSGAHSNGVLIPAKIAP
eukprot:1160277-Pelagomonas_calceolata.AAC.17